MLVLEYASNGDLLSYLRRYSTLPSLQLTVPGFGNERSAVEIFRTLIMFTWQVSKGMCHLEKLKVFVFSISSPNNLLQTVTQTSISDNSSICYSMEGILEGGGMVVVKVGNIY